MPAMVNSRYRTSQGEGKPAGSKLKKQVRFNPVVEFFYYDELDSMPDELKRWDTKKGKEGRLLSVQDLSTIYEPWPNMATVSVKNKNQQKLAAEVVN